MSRTSRQRSYAEVTVTRDAAGYGLALDGKPVMTPSKAPLLVPSRALAEAMAAEWAAQRAEIDALALPLTRLANAAIDLVAPRREEIIARTGDFAATDLLCYRAAEPEALALRQRAGWEPLLHWAAERYGASLAVAEGVMAIAQPPAAVAALRAAVAALDDMRLAAVAAATSALGSLVLGLALLERRLDPDAAFALSQLDESYQIERWGEDAEAVQRRAWLKADIAAAARFLALLDC